MPRWMDTHGSAISRDKIRSIQIEDVIHNLDPHRLILKHVSCITTRNVPQ